MKADLTNVRRLAERRLGRVPLLHDYQWRGVSFLLGSNSALLADEMGLGKTVQTAIALALVLREPKEVGRALIVAPAALTANWMSELAVWVPSVAARRVQGGVEDRAAFYRLPVPILVCSYEHVREDALTRMPREAFGVVVLDEAQRIKNRESATSFACRLLRRRRAWALSATPLENEFGDVTSILDFLEGEVGRWWTRAAVRVKLATMMLRRRKREVRAELPPVIVQDLRLDLSAAQREEYEELWATREAQVRHEAKAGDRTAVMLGLIARLKRVCNYDAASGRSTKLDALVAISGAAGQSARILVFSQYVETLRWISARLGMPHGMLVGAMADRQRKWAMEEFRSGRAPRALLVSLRAGGVGLNLGEASHVVLFDRWWNPAAEVQAIYRAHRFQREEPLHVVRFLVRDSIEERIASILEEKEQLFEDVVDSVERRAGWLHWPGAVGNTEAGEPESS